MGFFCNEMLFRVSYRVKGGEGMADFEQSYREYERMVHAFLLRLCGNENLAEELTQETF